MANRRVSSQLVIGVLIVVAGLALLGRTTGIYDPDWLFRFIPSLFVLAGLYALVVSRFRNLLGPLLVIVLAGAWQLAALGYISGEQVWDLWPLVIVLFGLSILLGQFRTRTKPTEADHPTAFAIFGGSETRSTSANFTGADLTALFGGVELDLRDAAVQDPPAHVTAMAAFGGASIVVPREWNVRLDVLPLLGGASDERSRDPDEHEAVDLVVTGMALFGGVSIED